MRGALQTGSFAGIFAVITLILFLTNRQSQLFSVTGIPISRLYSNTLMDTILCRGVLRGIINQSEPTGVCELTFCRTVSRTLTGLQNSTSIGLASMNPASSIALQIHKEVEVQNTARESFQVRSTGHPRRPPPAELSDHKARPSLDSNTYPLPPDSRIKM